MNENYNDLRDDRVNTCVCSNTRCVCSRRYLPLVPQPNSRFDNDWVLRERVRVPYRRVTVDDGFGTTLYFDARTLQEVFKKCYKSWKDTFRLYYQDEEVNPRQSFEFYRVRERCFFKLDIVENVQYDATYWDLFTDDSTDSESDDVKPFPSLDAFELRSASLQSSKTFESAFSEPEEFEPFVKLIEDICCLIYQLKKARSSTEGAVCAGAFIRSVTGRSNVYFAKDICNMFIREFQSAFSLQSDGHWINVLSDVYDNYSRCRDTELSRRLKKFFNHLIMHCVYHKLGIEVDSELFDKIEKKKVRPNLLHCFTFLDATASLIIFVLKQGRQVMLTGDIEHFFIDGDSLSVWSLKAKKLKLDSEFLANPGAVGLDVHTYLSDLSTGIAEGKSLVKYMKIASPEGRFFHSMLNELTAIEMRFLSVTASLAIRRMPLGVIIFGESNIGKSSVMDIIFKYDALIRGRNPDKGFCFSIVSESEYLTNFKSYMHTIIIDDAAMQNPAKIQGVDKTTSMIIRVQNVIPWNPPQAAVEEKGMTPMLNDLTMVSSNVHDLNIPLYFSASYAVMRRLPHRVEPVVRPEFCKEDGVSLDSAKVPKVNGFDDLWYFKISKVVRGTNMTGKYEHFLTIPNMKEFLEWWKGVSDAHCAEQDNFIQRTIGREIVLCPKCSTTIEFCSCETSVVQGLREIAGKRVWVADRDIDETSKTSEQKVPPGKTSDEFLKEFVQFHGSDDLFKLVSEKTRPWSVYNGVCGDRRAYTVNMSKAFIAKMNNVKVDPLHREYYAYQILPVLLTDGWPNDSIIRDFHNFVEYCNGHSEIEAIMDLTDSWISENVNNETFWVINSVMDRIFKFLVSLYFYSAFFRSTCRYFGGFHCVRRAAKVFLRPCLVRSDNQLFFVKKLGASIDTSLGGCNTYIRCALAFLSLGSAAAVAYTFRKRFFQTEEEPLTEDIAHFPSECGDVTANSVVDSCDLDYNERFLQQLQHMNEQQKCDVEQQGKIQVLRNFGNVPRSAPGDNKVNCWAVEDRAVTTEDFVPEMCRDLVGFERKIARNCLIFETLEPTTGGNWKYAGVLTVLSNEHFLTNSHSLPLNIDLPFTVYLGRNHLVSPKITFLIKQNQIERIPDRDIAIVHTHNLPALFGDVSRNFIRNSYNGVYDGFYLIKQRDGSLKKLTVLNIRKTHITRHIQGFFFDMDCFTGTVRGQTELGDCGSPLIALTGYGPVIVGYHVILDEPSTVFAAKFSHEDFLHFSKPMVVQHGKIPIMNIELYKSPKSYIDFHSDGHLIYHGELKYFRCRPQHSVVDTEFAEHIYGKTLCGVFLERRLFPPVMDSWRAQQTGLAEFLQPVKFMEEDLLQEISDVWVDHILSKLPTEELELIDVCNIDVAVNGVPGMAYVDGIKRSTSMGFPYFKTKKKFLVPLENDFWPDGVRFTDEVEARIYEWMETLREGIRLHAIFSANLKNEPVSKKKLDAWKTRIFFSCPAELLVIVRMFYLGFARVVQRNRNVFWSAVGLNTTSPEWEDVFQTLSKFGLNTAIAGDHVYYDKRVKMLVLYFVMDAVNRVCFASGNFSDEMKLMMEVLKYELMNPTVDFFGMLITLIGGEVSGHQLTTIFNIIMNIFYLMYAYAKAGYELKTFFDFVIGIILGDDHVLCVSPERPNYHHTQIQSVLEGLGLGYTMADKSAASRPYISLYEVSFLKRTFTYDVGLGLHVGRLEFNSIIKMITIQTKSKSVMRSTQLAMALCSAMSEMFFYGEEAFDEFKQFVDDLPKSESLQLQMLSYPSLDYAAYKRRFWRSKIEAYDTGLQSQKSLHLDSYCSTQNSGLNSLERVDPCGHHARAFPEICIYRSMELDTKENCKALRNKVSSSHENHHLSKTNEQMNAIQSEHPATEGSESSTSQQTQFVNETEPEVLMLGVKHDPTADSLLTNAYLSDYLSRPTKINTFTWTENLGAGNIATIRPWLLYFNTPSIKNKLEGFGYIRCKLHLKFTINASQFYYGSIGAFYTPLCDYIKDTTGSTLGYAAGFQVLQSQKPHVWLDPQTTSTAVMELPFLFYKNFMDTTTTLDVDKMGKIDFTQFAALRSANGVTTAGVNIVTYAWATDVELTGLTAKGVLQSKKDYVGNGQISGPASTVANVAKRLTDIPVIGPFAKATEMAAGAVGGIASMFGFTNVPNVKDVEPMKNVAFHTLSSSEISEPINKLSLQPKQEISVSAAHAGDPSADVLHIVNFIQRESFLCGSLWTTSTVEDGILFTAGVTPQLYEKSPGTNYKVYDTPMSYISRLFGYGRGDIIFRFKFIKTQYHRGRVSIAWDPLSYTSTQMPVSGSARVQNIIFDLEDDDTIEVRVPYMQDVPFMMFRDNNLDNRGPYWSNGPSPAFSATFPGYLNGIIQVRVVNRLTAPEASSDIDMLVFVRAAENFEFAGPTEINNRTFTQLQSKKEFVLGERSISHHDTYNEVFGEKIGSLRQLLHRQSKAWTQVIPKNVDWDGNQMVFTMPFQRLPRPYGYVAGGWEKAKGTVVPASEFPFNYVRVHPAVWLQYCFIGVKGSVNWTFNTIDNNGKNTVALGSTAVCRNPEPLERVPYSFSSAATNSTSQAMKNFNTGAFIERQGAQGMALTNQYTQAGLSVNIPYYSRMKFQINNPDTYYGGGGDPDDKGVDWYEYTLKRGVPTSGTTDADVLIDVFVGTGPDFDFVFFINCPVYTYLVPPTASATG